MSMSVAENLTLSHLEPFCRWGLLSLRRQRDATKRWIERLSIRTQGPGQALNDLSGGNQQKVALARLLHHDVDVLLLDEPTASLDGRSTAVIEDALTALKERRRLAILWVTHDTAQARRVADRVLVLDGGRVASFTDAEAFPWDEWDFEAQRSGMNGERSTGADPGGECA